MKQIKNEVTINKTDQKEWNTFIQNSPLGHIMQSYQWGMFKAATGWHVYRIAVKQQGQIMAAAQLLLKPLPLVPWSFGYIPKGPLTNLEDKEITQALLNAINKIARKQKAVFVKVEPNLPYTIEYHQMWQHYGFKPSTITNQPRSTILVDLSGGEAVVLSNMRKTTRKLFRRAIRGGVKIIEGDGNDLPEFYHVLKTTASLKQFSIHNRFFFEQAWQTFQPTHSVKLFLAKYKHKTVAAKMVFIFGNRTLHFWGGTTSVGRNKYASYLIQWQAIQWAIQQKCQYADLWGIPDEIGKMIITEEPIPKDRQGDLWGVYNFKRGFGQKVEYYLGAYDYVYYPLLYRLGTQFLSWMEAEIVIQQLAKLKNLTR